jgi:hypothetical protein
MPKTINDKSDFAVYIEADSTGLKSVTVRIRHDLGEETFAVDPIAASQAAVTALAGQGLTLTAAQVRQVWKQILVQAQGQGKAAGGWS